MSRRPGTAENLFHPAGAPYSRHVRRIGWLCVLGLALPRTAAARTAQTLPYGFDQTFEAAVRVLRVDLGYTISERDREAGFVLFRYDERGREVSGSVEIVRASADARSVRVVITIASMPAYVESALAARLERKLREDFGPPAPAGRPSEVRSAGADAGAPH